MSKNLPDDSYGEEHDDVNDYYTEEVDEDDQDHNEYLSGTRNKNNANLNQNVGGGNQPSGASGKNDNKIPQYYKDQPYDLAYDINATGEDEHEDSAQDKKNNLKKPDFSNKPLKKEESDPEEDEEEEYKYNSRMGVNNAIPGGNLRPLPRFDLSEFYGLNISDEVKDLLLIMKKFTPQENTLDTKMKPFIPGFIPSIGEVDAFIKPNRPDGKEEELGTIKLDEPTITGVDQYIFKMTIGDIWKIPRSDKFEVKTIPEAEKKPKEIQNWIEMVEEMRKNKISNSVSYTKKMPDIESLMQVWPEKFEAALKEIPFPNENINMSVDNYTMIICSMLDIPIHQTDNKNSLIEALHVLFTLYSEFKINQHFVANKENNNVQTMKFY